MAKYKIKIKASAIKELNKIPSQYLKKITAKISALSENPRPMGCEKLSGEEKYRIRQGNYRIIYSITDGLLLVHVIKIGHRKDIYKY
ncbi:MAG: type II toxin-antitoxin system RelE/ParE family toxin [Victivallaceae bacterium]|nr:type II toxin-antitoxin system RelE/ParE family toxin [Victivallaceae bacterium]